MSNGSNSWGVLYHRIAWLEQVLASHGNVKEFHRSNDIVFTIKRRKGKNITLLCLDQYAFGVSSAQRALNAFPNIDVIFIGGKWNKWTVEADEYCSSQGVEIINASELNRVLYPQKTT